MVEWTQNAGTWSTDTLEIRSCGPNRWELCALAEERSGNVRVFSGPLAVTETLSEAKRFAESITAASQTRYRRITWSVHFAASVAALVVALGLADPWNMFVSFTMAGAALRSLTALLRSWLEPHVAFLDDLFYQ
jgi:hypothetical protein